MLGVSDEESKVADVIGLGNGEQGTNVESMNDSAWVDIEEGEDQKRKYFNDDSVLIHSSTMQ